MKLILFTLLTAIAALTFTSCTTTRAVRGYEVNSLDSMSSAPGGWRVERAGSQTNLSYSDIDRFPAR